MNRFREQLHLARSENREVKQFNKCFNTNIKQDRHFHVDCDGDRGWDYDGLFITRSSHEAEVKSIGRSRSTLRPEYTIWIPSYTPATRWEPEDWDANPEEETYATLEDAIFECFKLNARNQYACWAEGEYWAEEAKREAEGYYENVWD